MHEPSKSLAKIARGDLCAGCGACAMVAKNKIEMVTSDDGYLRPIQSATLNDEEENAIAKVCPGLGQTVQAGDRKCHDLWGPYVDIRTGWAVSEDIRFRGSSGGALSAILAWLLETGQVDEVLETGPDTARPFANAPLFAKSQSAILEGAGSRYAPSAPLAHLPKDGLRRALVGKPCDIAAFRRMQDLNPDLRESFPVVLSFFCAGVPSLSGGFEIARELGIDPSDIRSFRYRGNGWPGRATATLTDGSERSMTYQDSWGRHLSPLVQHRCKICADGTGKAADIVCADAWETDEDGYPLFEERDGISLIVGRTTLGAQLIGQAEAGGAIKTQAFDISELCGMQPGQLRRRQSLIARLAALRVLGKPVPNYQGLALRAAAKTATTKQLVRNFAGTIKRALRS